MLLGGLSGGAYVLARAGLLTGRRCTVHWEHIPAFREDFAEIAVENGRFVLDRDRLTCAGGVAALDMMHALIEQHHGAELATAVSDWYLHTEIRAGAAEQRAGLADRYRVTDERLLSALAEIEQRTSSPPTRAELAAVGERLGAIEAQAVVRDMLAVVEELGATAIGDAPDFTSFVPFIEIAAMRSASADLRLFAN